MQVIINTTGDELTITVRPQSGEVSSPINEQPELNSLADAPTAVKGAALFTVAGDPNLYCQRGGELFYTILSPVTPKPE